MKPRRGFTPAGGEEKLEVGKGNPNALMPFPS